MLAEVLLIMSGHASSLLEPDGTIAPAFAPLLHPGEQQVLKELATLASQYRKLKQTCPILGQQSQYMSSLCAALIEILTEYEDLVVETEARILKRDSELVANATVVPLSAVKATFSIWNVQFAALCLLIDQLEAGPPGLDGTRWPPGPLIDLLLQRARTGVQRVAHVINRLALAVQRVWRSHLLAFLVHGILDAADPLARVADGYKLNPECVPSCVTPQTREAIAYIGRAVAVVGVGVPRQLAIVHARLVGRVLPQDRYAFDGAVERIKGNISEWLWTRVLTKADVIGAVECFANYFLLRNGEFALALLREIERLKTSRLSAKPTSRTSSGLIRDTDLSLAILRASLGTSAQNDPSLDSLRFTLVDGPLRPLLPPPSAALAPNKSTAYNGLVLFDDLLLGARATLSHTLAWPLDLVLGQAELQAYGAVFAYLSALRRGHVMVLECWGTLSGSWKARKKWEGTYARRKAKGKGKAGDLDHIDAEDEAKRSRLVKCAWGVVREMVWFLDTFWGYIMTDVIDVQYRKLHAQLRPQRTRSNSNRRSSTTTRATTRAGSPTSTHFGPSPSTQFGPSASSTQGLNLRGSASTTQHETLDFSTLRTLHATYLANIVSGSLLGHSGCASIVRVALETCERFVGMIERWGGDVLPGMLEEGSAGVGGALLDERLKTIKEIDEASPDAFYEQLSMSPGQGVDGSTIAGNTSAYLRDLFRPRGRGGKGMTGAEEDRRTVERLSLRLDFNAKFSEPYGYGYSKQLGILQQGGLIPTITPAAEASVATTGILCEIALCAPRSLLSGRCIFKHKCNFIHDGEISMRRPDVRAHAPVYRRTPENSVDSFSSSEEDEPVQEHRIDEHSAAAPSLIFSSIYGPRPNSINRLQLTNVDLPVSPESLPHTPPRTSRPTSHHSTHNHVNITSPTPSRPLSSSLGIGIGGRAQGGLAEVFTAIANTQTLAQSTTLPPSSAGSLPSPLSLSPKSPANGAQEIIIKDEGYSLEQLPFKLALSNQSSLLLNRTSRAAQRRSSTFSQQDTPSSSGADIEKRPTSLSVPERLSTGSLPKHLGDRPISVTSVEQIEEEGKVDDEQDEEEQVIVDESPSFEALQPYPRDVSTEPSPDPTRQNFVPPAPVPPLPPGKHYSFIYANINRRIAPCQAQPSKPPVRNDSSRHIDHELVIDELEERLGVSPTRRRRARSNAVPNPIPSAVSPNRSTTQPTGKSADAIWERKQPIEIPKSAVNMGAARDMLDVMFSKRNQQQEERIEEESSDEHENEQSFLPVDWDVGSMAGLDEEDRFEKHDDPVRLEPTVVQVAARSDSVATQRESTTTRREPAIPQDEPSTESRKFITVRRESTSLRRESTPVRPASTIVRRESTSVRRESTSVHREPAPVRRESISVRRESVGAQRKSAPRASIPVPISQPSPPILQAEAHPQTPSTPSTEPETPNTQLTQSTQPTPQSDHEFDEADTDDEHPEDLADLIEAEPVVLSTPRSVVLRREVGRETSLPSRAGTSTGAGTPGFWTPRHGSVVGGSGGLQVIESPTVEQIQHEQSQFEQRLSAERNFSTPSERRLSVEQNRPTLIERRRSSRLASIERRQSAQLASAERRQSTSSRRLEDITQSTVSESTLNTIGGQTENESPVSRPLVSNRDSVSVPVLGSVPSTGNGLGLDLSSSPSAPSPLGSDSGNDLGLGVDLSPDPVSHSPFLSTPLDSIPTPLDSISSSGNDSGLGSNSESGFPSVVPTPELPVALASDPHGPAPASPVAGTTLAYPKPQVEPISEPISTHSPISSPEPEVSNPIPPTKPVTPESAPQTKLGTASRADLGLESVLPEARAEPVEVLKDPSSVPSVETLPPLPPLVSESTSAAARVNPSLVAGPTSQDDLSSPRSVDDDPSPIPIHASKPSGDPIEPIRATPHADGPDLDLGRVVSRSSSDAVGLSAPERGDTSEDAPQSVAKDLDDIAVKGEIKDETKQPNVVVAMGKDAAEYSGTAMVNEKSTASIEAIHEDPGRPTGYHEDNHQELAEEGSQVINTTIRQGTVEGDLVASSEEWAVVRDSPRESFKDANKVIGGNIISAPIHSSGDFDARALVSDSEPEPMQDSVLNPTWPPSNDLEPVPEEPESVPVVVRSAGEREIEFETQARAESPTPAKLPEGRQVPEPEEPSRTETPRSSEGLVTAKAVSKAPVSSQLVSPVESDKAAVVEVPHNEYVAEVAEAIDESITNIKQALPESTSAEIHEGPETWQEIQREIRKEVQHEVRQEVTPVVVEHDGANSGSQEVQEDTRRRSEARQGVHREVQQHVEQEATLVGMERGETSVDIQGRQEGGSGGEPRVETLSRVSTKRNSTTKDEEEVQSEALSQNKPKLSVGSANGYEAQKPVYAAILDNPGSVTEQPASRNDPEEQSTPGPSVSLGTPRLDSVPEVARPEPPLSSLIAIPAVAPLPALLPSTSIPDREEAIIGPDDIDSLSELEEAFGVRSPVALEPSPPVAPPQLPAPSSPPRIPAPSPAPIHSSPSISEQTPAPDPSTTLQHFPVLPSFTPIAPLSPILPSSLSASPSVSEQLSSPISSSPPTTSSLPGSPSQIVPVVPLSPISVPEVLPLGIRPVQSSTKTPSEDEPSASDNSFMSPGVSLQPSPLEPRELPLPEPLLEPELPTQAIVSNEPELPIPPRYLPPPPVLSPPLPHQLEAESNPEPKLEYGPKIDLKPEIESQLVPEVSALPEFRSIENLPSSPRTNPARVVESMSLEHLAPESAVDVVSLIAPGPITLEPPMLDSPLLPYSSSLLDPLSPLPSDHALVLPDTAPAPLSSRESETVAPDRPSPLADHPRSTESAFCESVVAHEPTALPESSSELEHSSSQPNVTAVVPPFKILPSSKPTESPEAFPPSASSPSFEYALPPSPVAPLPVNNTLSQSLVAEESSPRPGTPPTVEPPLLRDPLPLLDNSLAPESSSVQSTTSSPEPPNSDLSKDPHPQSELTHLPTTLEPSESAASKIEPSPESFKPVSLPDLSTLPNSSPQYNSLLPNPSPPDVSIPLEHLSPRSLSFSEPPTGQAELPDPSSLLDPSTLPGSSSLISSSPFDPSPWPGLSVTPKRSPSPSSPDSPSSTHRSHLLNLSPSPKSTSLPDAPLLASHFVEFALPPTEDLQGPEHFSEPQPERLGGSLEQQEPQVTSDRRDIQGATDSLTPWGSLRFNRSPGLQRTSDDEQQLPKSSLLFDYISLPPDSPSRSYTPLPRLATLPEDSPLLQYAPSSGPVRSAERAEMPESEGSPDRADSLRQLMRANPLASLEHSDEPQSPPIIGGAHLSQRSSLSEIPSLSDFAPLPPRSDTAPQYVRTATLASEPRASSEPSSKPRPRSQLKPLRLSLMHGLGTPSPSAIITPVSANTATPSPGFRSDAATPTPTAMYPTPSSAHPTQLPARLRSATQSPPPTEEMVDNDSISESLPKTSGAESVSWFGSKKGVKRGTLSASRQSFRRSVHETEPTLSMRDATITSPGRSSASVVVERIEESSPQSPGALAEDEDVRPLPMIWDDETEAGSKAGSSRQGTRSPTRTIPMLDSFPPDSASIEVAPPLKSPDRLDTVPRYPTFVNIGGSPRLSEAKPPPPSPPAVLENVSESHNIQPSEVEPAALRSRKWADTVNQDSIGSLPDFSAPAPGTQMLDVQPAEADEPHTPRTHKDRLRYMPIPNTAPLSISPRRASPSMMQLPREGSTESYEQQGEYDQDGMLSYAAPHMAPLDLRLRMPRREGTIGPWMTEHFTNSPSSFHSSQVGSMHSASSSLSTGSKAMDIRRSISFNKLMNGPVHVEDGTFGNPGPGPTTMMTYSKRGQPVETLGSPIVLQPSSLEHAPSVPKTPQHHPSSTSLDATPRKSDDLLSLKISPAQIATEAEMNIHPATPSVSTQSPIQNHGNEFSPVEQRTPYKALSLSSPSPGPYPSTPLTAPSPLQILRRNLMARTSPESPRFLSPQTRFTNLPESRPPRHQHHASASLAPSTRPRDEFHNMPMSAPGPRDRRSLTPNTRFAATPSIPGSPAQSVHSTISQTKPLLFFAIAKNSAQEVERLLQDGEVKPNDKAGPEDLPALAFALANEQLTDKTQIVKSLLSHGADPSSVLHRQTGSGQFDDADLALTTRIEQGMNPAIRYYLNRKQMTIPAPQAELLEKNNFGGLTRAGFSIIGQDAALEELIRVVAGHCRRKALNPLVVVFSGGPGCGKSLLASKIGPLLHVPYFTINMTNLRNEAALFNYISMTTKVGQPKIPLMDFLRDNQGQRCVVVLEEIEKAADKTVWHSLLMPWELGKATVISPLNNEQIDIDTSQVIWIATSNSGDDATLKFFAERSRPSDRGESALARLAHNPRPKEDNFTRNDYLKLMQAVRKRLGELLGSSMISRVSSVLPFLPFTEDEVYALASESLSAMRAEQKGDQSYDSVDWDELLQQAVGEYIPGEGARSVHRAVQRAFDEVAEW
ncbi:hypothetical protein RHS03_00431, partial [Rhizoctonia solani]